MIITKTLTMVLVLVGLTLLDGGLILVVIVSQLVLIEHQSSMIIIIQDIIGMVMDIQMHINKTLQVEFGIRII